MIDVSYLQNIYTKHVKDKKPEQVLHRSHITDFGTYPDWSSFVTDFAVKATHPLPATAKGDAFGWCATLFHPNGEEDAVNERNELYGGHNRAVLAHRAGEHAEPLLTLFFADLDNHKEQFPRISIDDLENALRAMSFNFMLYTSFSHKPERNKVRIIIPVNRPMTLIEAFEVFIPFNHALNFQLDGSVYDSGDFLYGPPLGSDIRICEDGQSMDVDYWLKQSAALPEEVRNFVPHSASEKKTNTPLTVAEKANAKVKFNSIALSDDVSINNPKYFNPAWLALADDLYQEGSHFQTMFGLLRKVWIKSDCTLFYGDLESIVSDLDSYWCGYLSSNYPAGEIRRAIKSVMNQVGLTSTIFIPMKPTHRELHASLNRMKRRNRK
jgi:hypothetical protein